MSEIILPSWAENAVAEINRVANEFGAIAGSYKKSSSPSEKSLFLGDAISKFDVINEMFRRWKFIAKSTPMDEIENWMEDKRIQLIKDGFPVKVSRATEFVNVLFLDTETTGLDKNDQPISIGLVLVEAELASGKINREIASYYGMRDPSCKISDGAYAIHGIKKSDLFGKEFDALELVTMFGVSGIIIAHNAKFDKRMLSFLSDVKQPEWGCSCWDVDWPLDVAGRSLDDICKYYKINRPAVHNAMADVRSMIEALQKESSIGKTFLSQIFQKFL